MDLKCSQLAPSEISLGLVIGFIGFIGSVTGSSSQSEYTLTRACSASSEY